MFRAFIIFGFTLLSLNSWGWSGRDVWQKASREQKLFLLEEYRIFFSKNPQPLGLWKEKKTTFVEIIQKAYANELNCVFAGWPSLKVGENCAPPSTHNPSYQAANCGEDKIQCQPLMFGSGLCTSVKTDADRNFAFANCLKSFTDSGKTYEQILEEVESSNKQIELLSLLDFADKACQTGFQAPLLLCRRLEAVVIGLKEAMEEKDDPETDPEVDPEVDPEADEDANVTLVGAAGVAVNLNETVQNAGQLPTNCPPGVGTNTTGQTTSVTRVGNQVGGMYGPEQALSDINNGELTFIGRDLFKGHEERSCVYKSQSALVIYHNCMADRLEHPITDIEVVSFTGSSIRFYVENTEARPEISSLTRAAYDNTWSINFKQGPALAAGSNLEALKTYKSNLDADFSGSCWIGDAGGAKANGQAKCHGNLSANQAGWAQSSESFWKQPSENWITTKKSLREKVRTSRF